MLMGRSTSTGSGLSKRTNTGEFLSRVNLRVIAQITNQIFSVSQELGRVKVIIMTDQHNARRRTSVGFAKPGSFGPGGCSIRSCVWQQRLPEGLSRTKYSPITSARSSDRARWTEVLAHSSTYEMRGRFRPF